MEGVSNILGRVVVRKLVLAALAAWVIALPTVANAQPRGEGQGRARGQVQQPPNQDARRGGGFAGMLRDIAGARLDRAHADRRSFRPGGMGNDRGQRRR